MITKTQIGERLKQLRLASNLSQAEIAQKLNTHQNAISRMENGQGGTIDLLFDLVSYYSNVFYVGNFFHSHFEVLLSTDVEDKGLQFKELINEILKEHIQSTNEVYGRIGAILEGK